VNTWVQEGVGAQNNAEIRDWENSKKEIEKNV